LSYGDNKEATISVDSVREVVSTREELQSLATLIKQEISDLHSNSNSSNDANDKIEVIVSKL
jgi:hypothetical protein